MPSSPGNVNVKLKFQPGTCWQPSSCKAQMQTQTIRIKVGVLLPLETESHHAQFLTQKSPKRCMHADATRSPSPSLRRGEEGEVAMPPEPVSSWQRVAEESERRRKASNVYHSIYICIYIYSEIERRRGGESPLLPLPSPPPPAVCSPLPKIEGREKPSPS